MNGTNPRIELSRRRLLTTAATGVAALSLGMGALLPRAAQAVTGTVRWVSPRGTIEVLDDYPYWVAKKYGYFGDIQTTLEPGPIEATATVKLVDQEQSDMGYPSPGVFSLALEQGIPLVSAWEMGAYDVFDIALPKGSPVKSLADLQGKTVALGSAGWQAICDPMFAQAGVDPKAIKYAEAGQTWGQSLQQGQADAALSWEGLRAQWTGQGLDFDYLIGRNVSKFPANTFIMRRKDYGDASKKELYESYLRGWAMGLEYGYQNPRAATHIVMQQFPSLKLTPDIATESMMQLANVFRGNFEKRQGWGWHDLDAWKTFLTTIRSINQISKDIDPADVIKNDYVAGANNFDKAKVKADADGYQLPDEYKAVDVEKIRARV
ncbi:MAG TPA: ABC transporter substrate-binding protein [Methylomirabilota bacterium]|nr:ABC transporter substrate-binding protein [Methylomirabilota bacterium]